MCHLGAGDEECAMPLIDDSWLESSCQTTCRLPDGSIHHHALHITRESSSRRQRLRELDVVDDSAQLWRRRVHRHETDSESGLAEAAKNSADVSDGAADSSAGVPEPDREDCGPPVQRLMRGTPAAVGGDEEADRLEAHCCQPAGHRPGDLGDACGYVDRAQFPHSARCVVSEESILCRSQCEQNFVELRIELAL